MSDPAACDIGCDEFGHTIRETVACDQCRMRGLERVTRMVSPHVWHCDECDADTWVFDFAGPRTPRSEFLVLWSGT